MNGKNGKDVEAGRARGSTRRQGELRTLFGKRMVGVDTVAEATVTIGVIGIADKKAVARRGRWHYSGICAWDDKYTWHTTSPSPWRKTVRTALHGSSRMGGRHGGWSW